MSRGNARLPIFGGDADKDLFIDRMVHFGELYRIEIRAYCVMINYDTLHPLESCPYSLTDGCAAG